MLNMFGKRNNFLRKCTSLLIPGCFLALTFNTTGFAKKEMPTIVEADLEFAVTVEKLLSEVNGHIGTFVSVRLKNKSNHFVCVSPSRINGVGWELTIFSEGDRYPIRYIGPKPVELPSGPVFYMIMPSSEVFGLFEITKSYEFKEGKHTYSFEHEVIVYDCKELVKLFENESSEHNLQYDSVYDSVDNKIVVSSGIIKFTFP